MDNAEVNHAGRWREGGGAAAWTETITTVENHVKGGGHRAPLRWSPLLPRSPTAGVPISILQKQQASAVAKSWGAPSTPARTAAATQAFSWQAMRASPQHVQFIGKSSAIKVAIFRKPEWACLLGFPKEFKKTPWFSWRCMVIEMWRLISNPPPCKVPGCSYMSVIQLCQPGQPK